METRQPVTTPAAGLAGQAKRMPAPAQSGLSYMRGLLRELRRLTQRRFNRADVCRYMGRNTNTLQRLNDPSWCPRLDTLEDIERFVRRAEDPAFRLRGPGWHLEVVERGWLIVTPEPAEKEIVFADPDAALAAAESHVPASPVSQETQIAQAHPDHDPANHPADRPHHHRLEREADPMVLDRP